MIVRWWQPEADFEEALSDIFLNLADRFAKLFCDRLTAQRFHVEIVRSCRTDQKGDYGCLALGTLTMKPLEPFNTWLLQTTDTQEASDSLHGPLLSTPLQQILFPISVTYISNDSNASFSISPNTNYFFLNKEKWPFNSWIVYISDHGTGVARTRHCGEGLHRFSPSPSLFSSRVRRSNPAGSSEAGVRGFLPGKLFDTLLCCRSVLTFWR